MCEHSKRVRNQMWKRVITVRAVGWKLSLYPALWSLVTEFTGEIFRASLQRWYAKKSRKDNSHFCFMHLRTRSHKYAYMDSAWLWFCASLHVLQAQRISSPPTINPRTPTETIRGWTSLALRFLLSPVGSKPSVTPLPLFSSSLSLSVKPPYTCPLIETANN